MLNHRLRSLYRHEDGLTLIELLIVIVILGVLSGLVILAVSQFTDEGDQEACESDVKTVEAAAVAHYADADPHAYPADVDELVADGYLKDVPEVPVSIDTSTGEVSSTACP